VRKCNLLILLVFSALAAVCDAKSDCNQKNFLKIRGLRVRETAEIRHLASQSPPDPDYPNVLRELRWRTV
jgi:hypothetical protein